MFYHFVRLALKGLILTYRHLNFHQSCAIEVGLYDFHKMVLALMKMYFPKRKPRIITYQKYKNFCNETFLTSLQYEVDEQRAFLNENGLDDFSKIFADVLEKTCTS